MGKLARNGDASGFHLGKVAGTGLRASQWRPECGGVSAGASDRNDAVLSWERKLSEAAAEGWQFVEVRLGFGRTAMVGVGFDAAYPRAAVATLEEHG